MIENILKFLDLEAIHQHATSVSLSTEKGVYLIPQTSPEPVAHISTLALVDHESSKLIFEFPRLEFFGICIFERTPTIWRFGLFRGGSRCCRRRTRCRRILRNGL